jgi:hypothetical protein
MVAALRALVVTIRTVGLIAVQIAMEIATAKACLVLAIITVLHRLILLLTPILKKITPSRN